MSGARFTPQAVAEIRAQYAARTLNVRAWAQAYNVSLETVRRIARGDTYRDEPEARGSAFGPAAMPQEVLPPGSGLGPVLPPPSAPVDGEPDPEALAASFARLQAATADVPPRAEALLDEMLQRGRATQPAREEPTT